MKNKIKNALIEIGIPCANKGFNYITDAVLLLDMPEWKYPKWTALYAKIAKMNNTTASRAERAIRHGFEIARSSKGNREAAEHYIGFAYRTNSNSLMMLHFRIKQEMEETESA